MKRLLATVLMMVGCLNVWAETFEVDGLSFFITSTNTVSVSKGSTIPAGNIIIPSSVEYNGITYYITWVSNFKNCSELTSVIISEGIKGISFDAFYDCSELTSVSIPESVTDFEYQSSFANYTFGGCSNLQYNEYGNAMYLGNAKNPYLWLIRVKSTDITSCQINANCKNIFYDAFNSSAITSVSIPNSVNNISFNAFYNCNNLQYNVFDNAYYLGNNDNPYLWLIKAKSLDISSCKINSNCKFIQHNAFGRCDKLESINIPNGIKGIGSYAFYNCSSLTANISESVTSIGKNAFYGVKSIRYADYKDVTIDALGFIYKDTEMTRLIKYTGSENVVTIPTSVTSIGKNAFGDCKGLISVTIPKSVTNIGKHAFANDKLTNINVESGNTNYSSEDGVLFNYNKTTLISCPKWKTNSYTIPESVTLIEEEAFAGCRVLTSITIGNSVKSIGAAAFASCNSLSLITIPNSVESLGDQIFLDCNSLTSVTIGKSTTSIGSYAFMSCDNLTEINVEIGNTKYSSENGVLFNYNKTTLIVCPEGKGGTYTIPNTVTSLRNNAFSDCSRLTTIRIPKSITKIGNYMFYNCFWLRSIDYEGQNEPTIGTDAFKNVSSLTSICVPEDYNSETFGNFTNIYKGHDKVATTEVAATCSSTGLTEGLHCSKCKKVFIAQETTSALGHDWGEWQMQSSSTCSTHGKEVRICQRDASHTESQNLPLDADNHEEVVPDPEQPATCMAAGLSAGSHCSKCGEILVAQTEIPQLQHVFTNYTYNDDATTEADGTETALCDYDCGTANTRTVEGTRIPDNPTAVAETQIAAITISTRDKYIIIENAQADVDIFGADGHRIAQEPQAQHIAIAVDNSGVYVVKCGALTKKVAIY